jgi:hypothetical protein
MQILRDKNLGFKSFGKVRDDCLCVYLGLFSGIGVYNGPCGLTVKIRGTESQCLACLFA